MTQANENLETVSGDVRITDFANAVSDALHTALDSGLEVRHVASVLAAVAADYMRVTYGPDSLLDLTEIIVMQGMRPEPENLAESIT